MRKPRPAFLGVMGLLGLAGLLACGLLACGQGAEDIAAARTRYAVVLDGFVVRQEPVPGAGPGAAPRLAQDVELDLTVRREPAGEKSPDGLPGVTVDVDQVDAGGRSRRHWRVRVDTAGLAPGGERRADQVLEGVDYAPGDGFKVEVRQSVPEAERAQYSEWGAERGAAATGSGPNS